MGRRERRADGGVRICGGGDGNSSGRVGVGGGSEGWEGDVTVCHLVLCYYL